MKCILFDIGGVLVDLNGVRPLLELCPQAEDVEDLHKLWVECPAARLFETGKMGYEEFCAQVIAGLEMDTTPEDFADAFRGFIGDVRPGVIELLQSIRTDLRIGCLSNTSPVHTEVLKSKGLPFERFDPCLLSYETGCMKPDESAYTHACGVLGLAPEEILFLDDSLMCVESARNMGMNSEQATSVGEAREILARYDLLSEFSE